MNRKEKLSQLVMSIENPEIRETMYLYLNGYVHDLFEFPASTTYHHVYEGGLIDHIIEVVEISMQMTDMMIRFGCKVDKQTLLVAGLIHDMEKLHLYYFSKEENRWKRKRFMKLPHGYFPIDDWETKMETLLPRDVKLCIMGHMGGWSKTGVYPDSIEAAILHSADLLSSRIKHTGKRKR